MDCLENVFRKASLGEYGDDVFGDRGGLRRRFEEQCIPSQKGRNERVYQDKVWILYIPSN